MFDMFIIFVRHVSMLIFKWYHGYKVKKGFKMNWNVALPTETLKIVQIQYRFDLIHTDGYSTKPRYKGMFQKSVYFNRKKEISPFFSETLFFRSSFTLNVQVSRPLWRQEMKVEVNVVCVCKCVSENKQVLIL